MTTDDVLADLDRQLRVAVARRRRAAPARRLAPVVAVAAVALLVAALLVPRGAERDRALPAAPVPGGPGPVLVAVADAAGSPGLTAQVGDRLAAAGFGVRAAGATAERRGSSLVVARSPRSAGAARAVAEALGVREHQNVAAGPHRALLAGADVLVLAGRDLAPEGWTAYAPLAPEECRDARPMRVGGAVPSAVRAALGVFRADSSRFDRAVLGRPDLLRGSEAVRVYADGVRTGSGLHLVAAEVTRRGAAFHPCGPADPPGAPGVCLDGLSLCLTIEELRREPHVAVTGGRTARVTGMAPDGVRAVVLRVGGRDRRFRVGANVFEGRVPGTRPGVVARAPARYERE